MSLKGFKAKTKKRQAVVCDYRRNNGGRAALSSDFVSSIGPSFMQTFLATKDNTQFIPTHSGTLRLFSRPPIAPVRPLTL